MTDILIDSLIDLVSFRMANSEHSNFANFANFVNFSQSFFIVFFSHAIVAFVLHLKQTLQKSFYHGTNELF